MSLSEIKRRALSAWERLFRHYFSVQYERMPWAASNYGTIHEVVHVTVSVTPPPDAEDEDDYAGGGVAIFNAFRRRNSYRRLLDRSGSVDVLLEAGRPFGGGGGGWRRLRKSASTDGGVGCEESLIGGDPCGRHSPRSSVSAQLARLLDFRRLSDTLAGDRKRSSPSREAAPSDGEFSCAKGSPTAIRRHRLRSRRRASSSASTATATASSPLKRVLQSFGSLYRTVSAEGSKSVSPPPPSARRILRTPAAYAYVRGLSGLATQRIPTKRSPRGCHPPCCSHVPIHFYVPGR
ncbi:uncharacterized protein LOC124167621 [Ischnura elegans]|uniref:uncharacterized protein LOC124167621 n=1 Tax=Ischnura elegans TaxID=197161 RepID=UPI001ED8B228|nr:uncharacterized protein LOC124167621 [Ischnura elegans]